MTNDKDNVNRSILPPKEREFYSYVRKIVESARYTGNADHEDVPSILRDFENKITIEVAREIFAEIEENSEIYNEYGDYYIDHGIYNVIKNKYTKGGGK